MGRAGRCGLGRERKERRTRQLRLREERKRDGERKETYRSVLSCSRRFGISRTIHWTRNGSFSDGKRRYAGSRCSRRDEEEGIVMILAGFFVES